MHARLLIALLVAASVTASGQTPRSTVVLYEGARLIAGDGSAPIERSAFLIGANGKIEQAWYKISPADTPRKLLEALGQ